MPRIEYTGADLGQSPYTVLGPDRGIRWAKGKAVEVSDDVARSLLESPRAFRLVKKAAPKKKGKRNE